MHSKLQSKTLSPRGCLFAIVWFSVLVVPKAAGEEALIAVASNFAPTMEVLTADFETKSLHELDIVYGSSGRIFAQISNGAPFDAFLSADQAKPKALEATELLTAESRFSYAIGQLALWSNSGINLADKELALLSPEVDSIALANPRLAPYGLAAEQTLNALNLLGRVQPKLVQGENIAQSYQFVFTGNAELGFVSLSQLINRGGIRPESYWVVPDYLHDPIVQDAVLLKRGETNLAAIDFLRYLSSDSAAGIINSFGYKLPEQSKRRDD